jgi:integrase
MKYEDYVESCLAAWKDGRRDQVIEVLKSGRERVKVGRAYRRFRRTLRGYRRSYIGPLTSHLRRALRELEPTYLDDLTAEKIGAWVKAKERKGTPTWTTKNQRRALRAFTSWAVRERLLTDDPVQSVKAPKVVHDPDALDPDDVPRVLEAAKGHPAEPAIALALLGGLRRGEIAALDWPQVNFRKGTLDLSKVKGGTKKRCVPMCQKLIEILTLRQLEAPDLRPAGGFHADTLSDYAGEILEKAGVRKAGPRRALQVLRRTWVSVLRHRGVAAETVTAWAGHSLDVEERFYRKPYAPANPELIERLMAR